MRTKATLLQTTNSTLTPEVIQELSTDLGLPVEKALEALKCVVPSLLMAFTHHGPGVEQLLKRNVTGHEAIEELLGNEFTDFATRLQPFTDMALYPIINMMEKLVPRLIPVLREHLKGKKLKATLLEETALLAEQVPTDISNHFGYGTKDTRMGRVSRFSEGAVNDLTDYPKH